MEKNKEENWSEASMEEWVEQMFRQGDKSIATALINSLPEESKKKYREIWKRIKAEKHK